MRKLKIQSGSLWLLCGLLFSACAGGQTHFLKCGDQGTSIKVGDSGYCVYTQEAVASFGGSFRCPAETAHRIDIEGAVVCSPESDVSTPNQIPQIVCDPIGRTCRMDINSTALAANELSAMAQRSCKADCDRRVRCNKGVACNQESITSCEQNFVTRSAATKRGFYEPFVSCLETNCGDDDLCEEAGVKAVTPLYTEDPKYKSCQSRVAECEPQGAFDEIFCGNYLISIDSQIAAFDACLAKPCAEIQSCIDAIPARPYQSAR